MECVEGALKNSFIPVKPTVNTQCFSDDFTAVIGVTGDDIFVDGLLDFSENGCFEENDDTHVVLDTSNDKSCFISPVKQENQEKIEDNKTAIGFSIPDNDLCLPADDVADLEWVSQFVDDSFSGGYSLPCPTGKFKFTEKKPEPEPVTIKRETVKPALTTPVQTKARSKRARTGGRVWSMVTSPLTDSSTSSSSSSSYTSNPWLFFPDLAAQTAESVFGKPPVKKQKKRNVVVGPVEPTTQPAQPRRCSHCLVQKTPQWRAGPLGAKTLCNACGVRYKSGRLLPEYRPACSPTFSSEVHSNNHRKVLEMRQKKEAADAGLTLPVRSF
ncbi:putative transcription factor C2C2-GATA family [Helianthus annuus]|nr:putative transcription factor C2C2-GATA family [Helianthus annuus]